MITITIFLYSTISKGQWNEIAKSAPSTTSSYDYYGGAVAVDGDYAVSAAERYNSSKGNAYVLFYDGTNWVIEATLTASDAANNDLFGFAVGISGNNIVIGSVDDDDKGTNSGSVYVFTKPAGGWSNMTETAKLTASDGASNDSFGHSVHISGDNIVAGAFGHDDNGSGSGAAYVFTKPSGGWTNMTETGKLTASDGVPNDRFGEAVSISGNNIVVGAYGDDDNGSSSGSAYVFTKPSGGWTNMTETAKLTASDGNTSDYFGESVSISGDHVVVGAYGDDDNGNSSGSAYVFTKPSGGWNNMTETAKLTASDGATSDQLGEAVSISGDNIVAGAYEDDDNGSSSGSAYVFTKPSGGWSNMTETAKLTASDGASSDYFGYAVAISGNNIVVGAYDDDDNGSGSGSAYLFRPEQPLPVELINFKGRADINFNMIEWSTASQIRNDIFVLEKSSDAITFEEIAKINGAGNSNTTLSYSFKHLNPRQIEYYRLKQVDFDGKHTYSKTIVIKNSEEQEFAIYPNPSNKNFILEIAQSYTGIYTVTYSNSYGAVASEDIEVIPGINQYQVEKFLNLSQGMYFVTISSKDGTLINSQKVIKK